MPEEAVNTKKAREKIKEIFQRMNYNIEEEIRFRQKPMNGHITKQYNNPPLG